MSGIRLIYWLVVLALGVWAVAELTPEAPTATKPLALNHQLQPGDLQTTQIARLTGRYLRQAVPANMPVTSDMATETPGPAAIESGFAAVVNIDRKVADDLHLHGQEMVQIRSGKQDVGKPGPIRALVCDETRCTVVIGLDQAPSFDPKLLNGAELARAPPPTNPAVGG